MGRTKGSKNGVHTFDRKAYNDSRRTMLSERRKKRWREDAEYREYCSEKGKKWQAAHRKCPDWGINSEAKRAASKRKWFENNKPIRVAAKRKQRLDAHSLRGELKADGCILCGYKKCMAALEFHHTGDDKEFTVSKLNTLTSVKREASKCIVVCANCHREIHAGQIEGYEDVQRAVPVMNEPPLLRLINGF